MRLNGEHYTRVLQAKGWVHDPILDVWINPAGDWFHRCPDGVMLRLQSQQHTEHDPAPQPLGRQ